MSTWFRLMLTGHSPRRSCAWAAKRTPGWDAGSVRSGTLRARPRTTHGAALQRFHACEIRGEGPSTRGPLLEELERGLGDDERAGPDDGGHVDLGGLDDERALEVAERLDHGLLVGHGDDDDGALLAPLLEQAEGHAGRRLVEGGRVDDGKRPLLHVRGQRAAQRGAVGLLVDLHVEAARRGRKHDATARELGGADGARAGTAGALLAPRLAAAARHHAAALGRAGAGALRVELGAHCLVDEVRLHLGAEDRLGERYVLLGAQRRCFRGGHLALLLTNLDDAVLRAGDRALEEQEVLVRLDGVDGEPDLRDALAAHAAGHANALEHPG